MNEQIIINIASPVPVTGIVTKSLRNYTYVVNPNQDVILNYNGEQFPAKVDSIETLNGMPYSVFKAQV